MRTVVFALLTLGLISCGADVPVTHVVRKGIVIDYGPFSIAVKSKPNDGSRTLGEVKGHDTVSVTDYQKDDWILIQYGPNKEKGYILARDITPAKFARPAHIKDLYVPLKSNPGENQPTKIVLHKADSVDYLDDFDDRWVRVCTKSGTLGFVELKQLSRNK